MATIPMVLRWCFCAIVLLMISIPAAVAQADAASDKAAAVSSGGAPAPQAAEIWYSLQVGAFRAASAAQRAVTLFRKKGEESFYRHEETGKGKWYRVYVGRYPSRQAARLAAAILVQKDIAASHILRKMVSDRDAAGNGNVREPIAPSPAMHQDDKKSVESAAAPGRLVPAAESQDGISLKGKASEQTRPAAGSDLHNGTRPAPASDVIRLTLADAIRYSLEGNREIAVVSYEPQQAQAQIEGAESVYDTLLFADSTFRREPNLESSVTDIVTEDETSVRAGIRKPLKTGGRLSTYLETRSTDVSDAGFQRTFKNVVAPTIELTQPLLNNIGSRQEKAAIKIAGHRASISDAELRRKVVEVTHRVTEVYWKLYLARELIAINRKNLDMAEEVHRREAERYDRGISQRLDVERAASNAQVRRSTWLRSLEEYQLTMDRLKLLLNWRTLKIDSQARVIPTQAPATESMAVNEFATIERALNNRPEIVQARQELMIREVDERLAAHQRLPSLDFIGRYSISGYGDELDDAREDVSLGDDDAWEVGVQFEWAFGNRLAKSRLKAKSLSRQQAIARLRRIEDDIKLDVKQVLHRLATLEGEIDSNGLAREAAEKVVEGEFTRFDIGQTSNEELLRAQDLLAATSRSFVRAIADYNTAVDALARATGDLPAGIVIED